MLRNITTYAALAAVLSAGTAVAATHEITILDNDLMPPIVFAEPGDTIRFVNEDAGTHEVRSNDASWTTQEIEAGVAVEFTVTPEMSLEYTLNESYFLDYSSDISDDVFEGVIEDGFDLSDGNQNGELDEGEITFEAVEILTDAIGG